MQEKNKEEPTIEGDASGPIVPTKPEKAKVETPEKPVAKKEKEVETYKTYSIDIHVNDPLPQANDVTVDISIGAVTYDEATDTVSTESNNPKYQALFNRFSRMPYMLETKDAPLLITRGMEKEWVMNLHNAMDLLVHPERNIRFFASAPVIVNEEPIIS